MSLTSLELSGFKSFGKKTMLSFGTPITAVVGPNGSGKSNIAESFRFVLGEQSIKSLRGKRGEDLIFNGSRTISRSNRASVKLTFDNGKRIFDLDFDEVTIERTVHRDGVNEYGINGSKVRLRDVVELLASAHIGASGHYIIAQGEADRILNATIRERRSMVEDALGLKLFHYKKQESERKLEKTEENIHSVEALRKEIAPHLRFLKKQVAKVERAKEMRYELTILYKEYFKREHVYLQGAKDKIAKAKQEPKDALSRVEHELERMTRQKSHSDHEKDLREKLRKGETALHDVRNKRTTLMREVGKIEGLLSALAVRLRYPAGDKSSEAKVTVPLQELEGLSGTVEHSLQAVEHTTDLGYLKEVLRNIGATVRTFVQAYRAEGGPLISSNDQAEHDRLFAEHTKLESLIAALRKEEQAHEAANTSFQQQIEEGRTSERETERARFELKAQREVLRGALIQALHNEEQLIKEENNFKRELGEAAALVGREAVQFEEHRVLDRSGKAVSSHDIQREDRTEQGARLRALERIKIRLEETGGGQGEDVMKEYEETQKRDVFLEQELSDLAHSKKSLALLISELDEKLNTQFKEGLEKINKQLQEFFSLMFGGGRAALHVVKERRRKKGDASLLLTEGDDPGTISALEAMEEESSEGITIEVNLPHKRIKGLEVLSGGERALTSIALLFAISQVTPPPFIVLDETDAALDEANSKKYGDMVENLSKHSQLILITHNRETMSRAGILYGVTMGKDAVSQLLSVQFDEAVQVAK
jgi:chromosome segregation protein